MCWKKTMVEQTYLAQDAAEQTPRGLAFTSQLSICIQQFLQKLTELEGDKWKQTVALII